MKFKIEEPKLENKTAHGNSLTANSSHDCVLSTVSDCNLEISCNTLNNQTEKKGKLNSCGVPPQVVFIQGMQRILPLQIFVQGNLDSVSGVNKVSHQWPWFNPCLTLLEDFVDKFVNNMSAG